MPRRPYGRTAVRCGSHRTALAAAAYTWTLEATTEPQEGDFRRLAYDDLSVLVASGLAEPDKLELETDKKGRLRAYWNGQGWIG